jgi:hypothetical protein
MQALRFLPPVFMAMIAVVTYAAIMWTLPRGFGWGDESFAYTLIASNRKTVGEAWGFQHLLHPLWVMTGESVLAFRVLRLTGYVLLSIALVWAARFVMRRIAIAIPRSGWVFILLLAQVGTFLAWSYPPRYLSYNELSSWLAQLGVALILMSLAWGASAPPEVTPLPEGGAAPTASSPPDQPPLWALWAIWAGLGGVTTLMVFAKVTSAVIFAAVLALALVVPNPYLRVWRRAACLGAGGAAALLVLWVGRVPIGFYFQNAYSLVFDKSVRAAFGHPTSELVATYTSSLLITLRSVLPVVLLFALAMATLRWRARSAGDGARAGAVDWVTWILGVLLLVGLVDLRRNNTVFSYLGDLTTFIGAAGIIGLAIRGTDRAATPRSAVSRSFPVVVGGLAVVVTPFICAFGTNNHLFGQFVYAVTLWAVVLGIALALLTQRATLLGSRARSLPILIGCLVILLAANAVRADIAGPYGTAPLLSQETSVPVPELRGILLTKSDARWVVWLSAAGDALDADRVPATAVNAPGALFVFNHSGYANPWVGQDWPAAFNSLSQACTKNPRSDLIVLQPGTSNWAAASTAGVAKSLAACGIRFPADFRIVNRHRSSQPRTAMTIWQLKR